MQWDSDELEREDQWDQALAMIDTATMRWRSIVRLVCLIRRYQRNNPWGGWAWISYEDFSRQAHVSVNTVRALLGPNGELWKTMWIVERGPTGLGTRPSAWRLQPASHWRRVPWLENDREVRAARIGVWRAPDEVAEQGLSRDSLRGIARQSALAARNEGEIARLAGVGSGLSRDSRGDSRGYENSAARKPPPNRATSSGSAARSQASNRAAKSSISAPSSRGESSPAFEVKSELLLLEQQQQSEAAQQITTAIEAKTRCTIDGPSLIARVAKLARDPADLDKILAAVEQAPAHYMAPMVVRHCEAVVVGRISLLTTEAGPDPAAELAALQRQISHYTNAGYEPPDELTAALAACQNRLDEKERA